MPLPIPPVPSSPPIPTPPDPVPTPPELPASWDLESKVTKN